MLYNSIRYSMGEKAFLALMHFVDLLITGGLVWGFIKSIDDWQAVIYLSVFIMFAWLRGRLLVETILDRREKRRRDRIDNDQAQWENEQKRLTKNQ